jgi:Protein of unknown function (DUF3108)
MNTKLKIGLIALLACLCCDPGLCQSKAYRVKVKPFAAGEELSYSLKLGPIHGGNAEIRLHETTYRNSKVYFARVTAKTIGIAEKIYGVKDVFDSYFDMNTSLPYKAIRNVKEGNYTSYCELYFNHMDSTVYSTKTDSLYKTPPGILDILSSLYFLRGLDPSHFKKDDLIYIVTFWDDELYPFHLRYKGKEIVKTKYGKIQCHRFDPVVEPGRIFKSKDGMSAWFTDDKNFIPVRVRFEMVVGSLRCDLEQYANLRYELEVLP